jgi:hypothetical protein
LTATGLAANNIVSTDANDKLVSASSLSTSLGGTGKTSITANRLLGCLGTANQVEEIQLGTNLSFTGTSLNASTTDGRWTTVNTNNIYLTSTAGSIYIHIHCL